MVQKKKQHIFKAEFHPKLLIYILVNDEEVECF